MMPIRNQLTARGMCQLVRMVRVCGSNRFHVSKQFSLSAEGDRRAKLWIESKMRQGYSLW